jgi:hypothetical protein
MRTNVLLENSVTVSHAASEDGCKFAWDREAKMLRADFESNIIWSVVGTVRERIAQVRGEGSPNEIATAETIGFYADYISSFKETAGTAAPFFVEQMLVPVRGVLDEVVTHLDNRIAQGVGSSELDAARVSIESAMVLMAPWPRPYGRGGQVLQLNTLYEELLERQRLDLAELARVHEELRNEMEANRVQLKAYAAQARTEVDSMVSTASDAVTTVNAEKARIDELIATGVRQLADTNTELDSRHKAWQASQEANFAKTFEPFVRKIESLRDEASAALGKLRETETDFASLTAAAATDRLAGHFAQEAKTGRRAGYGLYCVGAVFIVAAAAPLLLLLIPGNLAVDPDVRWEQLAIRAGVGLAAASVATVAIRLGGRFFVSANEAKRMELDLKTFGPFLANVDAAEVDKARISLVERTLGTRGDAPRESADDSMSISAFTRVVEAVAKLVQR